MDLRLERHKLSEELKNKRVILTRKPSLHIFPNLLCCGDEEDDGDNLLRNKVVQGGNDNAI